MLLAGRVLAAFAHGAFFGIGAVVAADLVAPDKRAGAIATMFTGLTVANVVGVPMGTLIGQHFGWRATFAVVAGSACWASPVSRPSYRPGRPGHRPPRPRAGRLPQPAGVAGHDHDRARLRRVFAAITYITPMMTHVTGYADSSVTWLLVLFGLGLVGGNLIGGRYADRALMPMLYVTLGGLALTLALFVLTAHHKAAAAVTIPLIGAFGFATVPPLQKRVMDQAPNAPTSPPPPTSAPSTWATPSPRGSAAG
ncbi:MFS transporter [Streptomyces sp. M19]